MSMTMRVDSQVSDIGMSDHYVECHHITSEFVIEVDDRGIFIKNVSHRDVNHFLYNINSMN